MSLVVPVFDEQDMLGIFLDRASAVMEAAGLDHEYVFVNDGSSDQTLPSLIALSSENSRIRSFYQMPQCCSLRYSVKIISASLLTGSKRYLKSWRLY